MATLADLLSVLPPSDRRVAAVDREPATGTIYSVVFENESVYGVVAPSLAYDMDLVRVPAAVQGPNLRISNDAADPPLPVKKNANGNRIDWDEVPPRPYTPRQGDVSVATTSVNMIGPIPEAA